MSQTELIEKLTSLRPQLEAEGVSHLAIFGSRARGDHASDLDLLLDVDPGKRFSILDLVGVEHLVRDSVGIAANAFMRRSLESEFIRSISSDELQVF